MTFSPDERRAIRTLVHALGAVWMLGLLTYLSIVITHDKLLAPMLGMIGILFVRELFHGAENVTARIKFNASATGISGEVGPSQGENNVNGNTT